ncbi:MAG: hypothetical protein Q9166_006903 [cf. Caloplaca sp. 2 TL-2023]
MLSRDPEFQSKYQASGTGSAMLANRLSWFYDFKGPSITLDTACSSSLNALHLACSSVRSCESSMGIVAGCNLMLNPDTIMMSLSNLNFLSPESKCYSFDHRANGYSRGEGFGVVVIKLLSEALRDSNTIRAVIRATGSNQDGRTPGITQPSQQAQEKLIRDTYLSAGLDTRATGYFEAHGTGTSIGDPTEATAIGAVFKDGRTSVDALFVGAVKSNIGHLEGASGLAGVIKTIMILEKEQLSMVKDLSQVDNPEIAQPLSTALQVALVDLLASWGVRPSAVVGHSSGEIAAAYCVGAVSRESAWKLAYYRGLLASGLARVSSRERGSMMAVALSEVAIAPYLDKIPAGNKIVVACVNSPTNITVSGNEDAIATLKEVLDREHIFARQLSVGVAYHSAQMEEVAGNYLSFIQDLDPPDHCLSLENVPLMYSSVTGQIASAKQLRRGEYWVANLCSKVCFSDALSRMCSSKSENHKSKSLNAPAIVSHLVEIGPHSVLRRSIEETVGKVGYNSTLRMNASAEETILHLVGELHCLGSPVDLLAVNSITSDTDVEMLVDLPAYPFNHSHTYWHESRLSKNFRFRKHPPHELLGTPAADWNFLEAKWRNTIRLAENPWIKDHKLNGAELYPAAGMIVMAIEAARQVSASITTRPIKGYRIVDVTFLKAVRLSMTAEGVETQLYLRPQNVRGGSSSGWSEFQLYMISNNDWVENCRGTIITEYDEGEIEVDRGFEAQQVRKRNQEVFAQGVQRCNQRVDAKQLYKNLNACGFGFGPSFQTLNQVSYNDEGEATATINLCSWKDKVPPETRVIQQHVIHPTDLDGVFHLAVTALARGGWVSIPTMVPTRLRSLWISNDFLTWPNPDSIQAFSNSKAEGFREVEFDILAVSAVDNEPLIVFSGYRATAVTSLDVSLSGESHWRRICCSIDWKPDLDQLDKGALAAHCNDSVDPTQLYTGELIDEAELVCLYFMSAALGAMDDKGSKSLSPHLEKYLDWMRHNCNKPDVQAILSDPEGRKFSSDAPYREAILENFEQSGPEGKVYVTVGRKLAGILLGELDPLELLLEGKLLQRFYTSSPFIANYQKISAFVDLSAHKNPNQKILEIGAGTGGATGPILDILSPKSPTDHHGTPRYDQYTYTDISPGFFQDAKQRFTRHHDRLIFKTLDIEKDSIEQGFDEGSYDLIIASCVLHATTNIDTTLSNTRKLLKPGGKLLLFEPCNLNCSRIPFVFGLLPGWWLGTESHRRWGPLLSDEMWHEALRKNNFTGADICLRDCAQKRHMYSVVISTALNTEPIGSPRPKVLILMTSISTLQYDLAKELQNQLQSAMTESDCELASMSELLPEKLEGTFCICLPEVECPFLSGMQTEDFVNMKNMVKTSRGVLWLTGDGDDASSQPETGLATGFGRCMCSENPNSHFITLAIDRTIPTTKIAEYIVKVTEATFANPPEHRELEYVVKQGVLCINRVVEDNKLNDMVYSAVVPQEPELKRLNEESERALSLTISSPGLLNTLRFVDDPVEEALGAEEVEIKVKAAGVNFKDVMVALGQLPDKSLGQECAGIVTRLGNGLSSTQLAVGDRVCSVTHGAFKTFSRSHISSVHRIPEGMTFMTAATLPVVFCTAYYSLHHLARLKKGDSILIHAAAGGVGQAAIQLAQLANTEIFATVGTDQKKRLLMDLYNIPEDHIFSSRNLSFADGIKRLTKDRGVDVVMNSLAGQSLRESFECVAPLGRFIEIGKSDMYNGEGLPMAQFLKSVTFASVDLRVIAEKSQPLMAELMQTVMSLAKSSIKPPEPLNVFRASEVENAFRFLQSGKNAGKTVIEFHDDDLVPTMATTKPRWYFDENATYVITGGLGGLGRSIARWMTSRRAKYLLLLSRTGAKDEAAVSLLEELKEKGVNVAAPACDISDERTLVSILKQYAETFPPIKGCIQGAMVLRDGLFENMTLENFNAALRPKVQGSWNLHTHLPHAMDFFILLSSTGGVFGNRGQSNYAAGNTYQDALARYRVSRGEKCISLNLGLMLEVGFAAERQSVTDSLRAAGYEGIHRAEFLALLDHYCNPALPLPTPTASQIVTGVATPASLSSRGMPEIHWMSKPLFRHLRQMDVAKGTHTETSKTIVDFKALIESADSLEAAGNLLAQALAKKLAMSLSMSEADIETDKPVHAYGVDSLVAVEIRYWFLKEFKAEVAVFDILRSESIAQLSVLGARKSEYLRASVDGGQEWAV